MLISVFIVVIVKFFSLCLVNVFRLEDTLINLYLSGYSNQAIDGGDDGTRPLKMDEGDNSELQADGVYFSFCLIIVAS